MRVKVQCVEPPKKLVAVVGDGENGIFFHYNAGSVYVDRHGSTMSRDTLETVARRQGRKPIYEGDTVTITF